MTFAIEFGRQGFGIGADLLHWYLRLGVVGLYVSPTEVSKRMAELNVRVEALKGALMAVKAELTTKEQ